MSKIFRKVSLDRLQSPERLDEVMKITDSRGWIALAAIGMLLTTAVTWGFAGELPEKVSGSGILVRSGGVLEVVSSATGRVSDIPISVGDTVNEGQVVAWISQPEVLEKFQDTRFDLEALKAKHSESLRFAREDAALQRRSLAQRRSGLELSMEANRELLAALEQRLEAQEELLADGLIARPTLLATRQQYEQTEEKIRSNENDLARLAVEELAISNRLDEATSTSEREIEQAENRIAQVERQLSASTQITSPYTGYILELMTEPGQIISRGEPILSLDLAGKAIQDLVAIIYVPAIHGKKVKPGMEIQIAPSTVAREEFGMLLGRVTFVSSFPATGKGMLRVLKNQQLIDTLSGQGAPYEVHAELIVDPKTPSQYRWTSSAGPPTKIQSGTVADGFITVKSQRPVSRVLPILRDWLGV
ncbi:MAG: NHLP bacteriocin system secretion protein [Acidobacteriota bacterium]